MLKNQASTQKGLGLRTTRQTEPKFTSAQIETNQATRLDEHMWAHNLNPSKPCREKPPKMRTSLDPQEAEKIGTNVKEKCSKTKDEPREGSDWAGGAASGP